MDRFADIPVYHSIDQAAQAMRVAIKNEPEEFDEDEEHTITARDEVLVGLVVYLAHGHERILRILDMYCGKSHVVDATPESQFTGPTMHVEVDGKVLAEHVSTVDVRELLRKQHENEQERRILLDMAYRNCEE